MDVRTNGSCRLGWSFRDTCACVVVLLMASGFRAASAGDLDSLLTELYGGDGVFLETTTLLGAPHSPHFFADSLKELGALSEDITSSLGGFSVNSTVSSYTFDLELGMPVRSTNSLGPILSERATTLGARRLNVGFSYNRTEYKRFEGDDLNNLTLFFEHEDVLPKPNGDGILGPNPGLGVTSDVEVDRVRADIDIDLSQDVYTFYGTYGFLENLDIGVAIPIVSVDLSAESYGSVARKAVCVDGLPNCAVTSSDVHNFADPATPPEDSSFSSVKGSASGIGDILARGKYSVLREDEDGWMPNFAVLGQVVFPTGDEDDLLGTGDWRGMPMLVTDKTFGPINPHINLGFEFVGGDSDLHNLKYFVGFDARLHERVTTVIDLLGRWEPSGDGVGDNLLDIAVGGKYNPFGSLVFVSNFIVPLNRNEGLRADFIWALGVEYTFGAIE
jgi:hypothetical protein